MFDEEDTGFLEAKDLGKNLSDLTHVDMTSGDIDNSLRMFDMDGDGTILYDEVGQHVYIKTKNFGHFNFEHLIIGQNSISKITIVEVVHSFLFIRTIL